MISDNATLSHQDQLQRALAEVKTLREQLRRSQRLATMGTMTAMVAHEFNNILTPIINYAQMARTNPKLADKAIAKAADGGQRASSICQALLGMTHDTRQSEKVNLLQLVGASLEAMARDPRKDCIDLQVSVPADLEIHTLRVELQQVLLNLVMNARQALLDSNGSRNIEISAVRNGDGVNLTVADSGSGIASEHIDRIFEPFFTTKDSDTGEGGHGLGLAICHQIVASLGGTISVKSTPGQGAKFTVHLPE